jgi:hypothetical protein
LQELIFVKTLQLNLRNRFLFFNPSNKAYERNTDDSQQLKASFRVISFKGENMLALYYRHDKPPAPEPMPSSKRELKVMPAEERMFIAAANAPFYLGGVSFIKRETYDEAIRDIALSRLPSYVDNNGWGSVQ